MLAYAFDNAAPATIILVSGDRDFAYAVSMLRLRRYRVVLVSPPGLVHPNLKSQASAWLSCNCGLLEDSDTVIPTSPDRQSPRRSLSQGNLERKDDLHSRTGATLMPHAPRWSDQRE